MGNNIKLYLIFGFFVLVGWILMSDSFHNEKILKEREDWLQTVGTVTHTEFEVYENPNYDPDEDSKALEYRGRETIYFEFTRHDGTLDEGKRVREGLSPDNTNPTQIGSSLDVIYDPDGDEVRASTLPTKDDYTGVYIMRTISAVILLICAYIGIRWIIRRFRYDSGLPRGF